MNIPNDTGHPWRLHKFVEYQHKVPPIYPITLCEYARIKKLSPDECLTLAWFESMTYSEVTAVFLFERIDLATVSSESATAFWEEHKHNLVFGSARKHAKNMNWFVPLLKSFVNMTKRQPYKWLCSLGVGSPTDTYSNILKAVKTVKFTGRFASDLFMEILVALRKSNLISLGIEEPQGMIDWKNCSNLTSGLLNILYMDEEADEYDKTGKIPTELLPLLNKRILQVQRAIEKRYPDQDPTLRLFIDKICSFRNLFKASRYGGFHHDRQLEQIKTYQQNFPDDPLWILLYKIRKKVFNRDLLGEIGGWGGIRKERKKLWVEKGLTGIESIGEH